MSGTDDPTHVYWDLENRKGLWAKGEAMVDPMPTPDDCLSCATLQRVNDLENACMVHHDEYAALRQRVEELERQRVEGVVALCVCENAATPRPDCDCVTCTVKRADQRAQAAEAKLARVVAVRDELASLSTRDDRDFAARAAWHRAVRRLDAALDAAKGERS